MDHFLYRIRYRFHRIILYFDNLIDERVREINMADIIFFFLLIILISTVMGFVAGLLTGRSYERNNIDRILEEYYNKLEGR